MSGGDLIQEVQTNIKMLDLAVGELKERGRTFAQAEHDYKVAMAKFVTEKRAEKVPVTIVTILAQGDPEVAKLRMMRDIAESLYDSAKEAINSYKLKIRVINDQIEREWKNA